MANLPLLGATPMPSWAVKHTYGVVLLVSQVFDFMEHHILTEFSFSSQQGPESLFHVKVDVDEQPNCLQLSLWQPVGGRTLIALAC